MLSRGNSNSRGPEAGASLVGCRISEEGNASGTIEQGESGIAGRGQGFGCHQKGAGIGIPQRVPGVCVAGGADPALSPQSMESQVEEWYREVGELQAQTAALPLEPGAGGRAAERGGRAPGASARAAAGAPPPAARLQGAAPGGARPRR